MAIMDAIRRWSRSQTTEITAYNPVIQAQRGYYRTAADREREHAIVARHIDRMISRSRSTVAGRERTPENDERQTVIIGLA